MTALDRETSDMLAHSVAAYARRPSTTAEEHITTLFEQGWLQMALPEDAGGLGFGVNAAAVVAGGLALGLCAAPITSNYLAARIMALVAPSCATAFSLGEKGETVALAWEDGGDPTILDADGRISGSKQHVVGMIKAGHLLVTADYKGHAVLVQVDIGTEGLLCFAAAQTDGESLNNLLFDRVSCNMLAKGTKVKDALRRVRAEARLVIAAELMSHISSMLDLTLEHLRTRRQFEQSLGSFQALQHHAVDLYLHTTISQVVLDRALEQSSLELSPDKLDQISCRARARLNDTAMRLVRGSIQLFGALGTTEECLLAPHIKRVLALRGWLGTSAELRRYYSTLGH